MELERIGVRGNSETFHYVQQTNAVPHQRFRSKIKTPMASRPKAISADRICRAITPKIQPNTPIALIRHARLGEPVYAMTGSPVITAK